MKHLTCIPAIAAVLLASAGMADPSGLPLDLSAVTAIRVTGEASRVTLTTDDTAPRMATIAWRRIGWLSGWYSGWFFNDCGASIRARIEGWTLVVEVRPPSWLDPSDCTAEISANLGRDATVSLAQAALQANLTGDFSSLDIDGKAADISLIGRATRLSLRGDALRVRLAYEGIRHDETISVDARVLDADLDFGGDVAIDYAVEAKASWVTSALQSSPGARPTVRIRADMVRANIR